MAGVRILIWSFYDKPLDFLMETVVSVVDIDSQPKRNNLKENIDT